MADLTTSSGGIHPGKPIIWPSGKPTTVDTANQTQQSQQTQQAGQTGQAGQTQQTPGASTPSQQPASVIARPLSLSDISAHLSSLGLADSKFNINLISVMLSMGVEASKTNILKTLALLEGTDKSSSAIKSSIILMSKGIDSPEAVRILAAQLEQNPSLSAQITSVKSAMSQLQNAMMNQSLLPPALRAQITSLAGQFASILDDLPKKYDLCTNNPTVRRGDLITDLKNLKALLLGIREKINAEKGANEPGKAEMISNLSKAAEKLEDMFNNLVSQALLGQTSGKSSLGKDNFLYYQIPNTLTTPQTTAHIAISQDDPERKQLDPNKDTKLVICLETELLGKMAVSIYKLVKADGRTVKVAFAFGEKNSRDLFEEQKEELKKSMIEKGYRIEGVSSSVDPGKLNIVDYIAPIIGLGDLFRISNVV